MINIFILSLGKYLHCNFEVMTPARARSRYIIKCT